MVSPGTLCSLQGLSIPTWPAHILKRLTVVYGLRKHQASWQRWNSCVVRYSAKFSLTSIKLVARTFILSLHAFHLLFLRTRVRKENKWLMLGLGWFFIAFVVAIGPLALQKKNLGPYFGPSGYWYAVYRTL